MLVTNRAIDDPRVCMEAKALAAGHRYAVTVIGWDREIDRDLTEHIEGVTFCRLHLRSTHARGLAQSAFLAGFYARAWGAIRKLRPHVLHCHDLDTLPLGWRAARAMGAKLIFDAHENYPDMMLGHLPAPAVRVLNWLEKSLVARCDLLITVGGKLRRHYEDLGARRAVVVGNWKDSAAYQFTPGQIAGARQELGLNGHIAISFIANLGRERHLEPLMQAVAKDPRFACVIGGRGVLEETARRYAQQHQNILYLGHVPPQRVPLLTCACDVVYYGFDKANPNSRWSAPNKLYEAIAAGRGLLAGDFGEIGQTIRDSGCGILADTDTAEGIAPALEQLAAPAAVEEFNRRAGALQEKFSAAAATGALVGAYGQLTSGSAAGVGPVWVGTPLAASRSEWERNTKPTT